MRRVLAVLSLAALAACSSSSHHASVTTDTGSSATPTASAAGTSTPGAAGASSAAPSASTVRTSPSSSARASGPATSQTAAPTHSPTAAKGTPAGNYTYDSSGTQTALGNSQPVHGSATLTVSEVIGGSQSSTLHNGQGDTEQDIDVRDTGSYLSSLKISSQAFSKEFDFTPAALLYPAPAPAGKTWSWRSTSTDGKTTATATNKVLRTETVTIGHEQVPTVVLQTHLVISGDVNYTSDLTSWVAPSLRLPVKDHNVGHGSTGVGTFSFDVTDVMRSTHPA